MLVKNCYISIRPSFRAKNITKDKEGLIMKKRWINQEDMPFLNVHEQSTSKYMKQRTMVLQGKIDKSTIITRDFKIALFIIEGTSRQKEPKQFSQPRGPNWHLPYTPPITTEYTFFTSLYSES